MIKIPDHKDTIMIHALDTPKSWAEGKSIAAIVKEVTRWHVQERGWSGIAYALIIGPTGAVGLGRDLDKDGDVYEETGAGAKGWNKNVIHIALAGGKGGYAEPVLTLADWTGNPACDVDDLPTSFYLRATWRWGDDQTSKSSDAYAKDAMQ